jgi:hypothetical protein
MQKRRSCVKPAKKEGDLSVCIRSETRFVLALDRGADFVEMSRIAGLVTRAAAEVARGLHALQMLLRGDAGRVVAERTVLVPPDRAHNVHKARTMKWVAPSRALMGLIRLPRLLDSKAALP